MYDRIKGLLKRKSVKNGAWMYALQFFNMIVPLLTLPYITRILGSSLYGVFSIALNIVGYLQVTVEYGFGLSASRNVAINGKKDLNKEFTAVIASRAIISLICGFIALGYIFIKRDNIQLCISFAILLICVLGTTVQMNWLFQGLQEMKYISIVNIIARTVSTVLIFLLVHTKNDLYMYCLLYSVSPFLSGFIGCFLAMKKYALKFIRITKQELWNELKSGFYVFTTQLSAKVFGTIGITFLGIFASHSEVGIFSAIQKVPSILILLWTPIDQVIYPLSSKHFNNSFAEGHRYVQKLRKLFIPLFGAIVAFIAIFSKFGVSLLYGAEYATRFYWLLPLLLWVIVAIDNNFLGIQTLLGSGHDKAYGEAFQIGVAATIALNFILIKLWGGNGASWAPLLSELTLNVMLRIKAKPIYQQELDNVGV